VPLAFALPHSAQERQAGNGALTGDGARKSRQSAVIAEAEKLRGDLIAAYDESNALIKYLAGYDFIRQGVAMEDYETVCRKLETDRARIEKMSAIELLSEADNLPDSKWLHQVVEISRSVRTDARLKDVFRKADQYSKAGRLSQNSLSGKSPSSREVVAAPAYIAPICNFDNPSDYPSGADLAISNGVALGLHTTADALPGILGFFVSVPNFVQIALQIAAYAVDEVTNALAAVASDAAYCESIILYVEDNLVHDEGYIALLFTNDFYLSYMYRTVKSAMTKATNTTIPTNCGNDRLMEAAAYFDSSDNFTGSTGADRVIAYQKLRAAYQNIGAASCVQ